MKKKLFAFLVIFLLFIVILTTGLIFWLNKRNAPQSAFLIKESGTVQTKPHSAEKYQTLETEEIELTSGSFVKTDSTSFAHIILPNNSIISIDQNTEIQVEFTKNSTSINQLLGNTWNRVKSLNSNQKFEVTTPDTIAAVRGTKFNVEVLELNDEKSSSVFVEEGTISALNSKSKIPNVEIIKSQEFIVNSKVGLDRKLIKQDAEDKLITGKWFVRNRILDRDFDENKNLRPRDFRRAFRERMLQKIKNILEESTLDTDLHNEIKEKYDIYTLGLDICKFAKSEDIENDVLRLLDAGLSEYDKEIRYLGEINLACSDDVLTKAELNSLFNFYKGGEFAKFEDEIQPVINKYIAIGDDRSAICINYDGKTVESILLELEAIEDKYEVTKEARSEFGEQIEAIKLACRDNQISETELEEINKLR